MFLVGYVEGNNLWPPLPLEKIPVNPRTRIERAGMVQYSRVQGVLVAWIPADHGDDELLRFLRVERALRQLESERTS